MSDYYHEYPDFNAYIEHVTYFDGEQRSSLKEDDGKWSGVKNYREALDLATYGWNEGYKKMKSKMVENGIFSGFVNDLVRDVTGEFVDVDAYLLGQPECMYTFSEAKPSRFLRLIINLGGNCNVSADEYYERGCMLMGIIDNLESRGVRCEIWSTLSSYNDGNTYTFRVCVKKFTERLNAEKLTFVMCNPAWHRRLGFAEREKNPMSVRKDMDFLSSGGYGRTTDDKHPMPEGSVYIGVSGGDFKEALEKIKKDFSIEEVSHV